VFPANEDSIVPKTWMTVWVKMVSESKIWAVAMIPLREEMTRLPKRRPPIPEMEDGPMDVDQVQDAIEEGVVSCVNPYRKPPPTTTTFTRNNVSPCPIFEPRQQSLDYIEIQHIFPCAHRFCSFGKAAAEEFKYLLAVSYFHKCLLEIICTPSICLLVIPYLYVLSCLVGQNLYWPSVQHKEPNYFVQ